MSQQSKGHITSGPQIFRARPAGEVCEQERTADTPARGFIFYPQGDHSCVAGVALTECGTVYVSSTSHVLIGEILSKPIFHKRRNMMGTMRDGESELNFEVLDQVHPNTVRAALRRLGYNKKPLRKNVVWLRVHGD